MQPLARNTLGLARRGVSLMQSRASSNAFASGPPRYRVSLAEKAILGTVMSVSLLATPTWVLVHIRDYQGGGSE